jgi:hypothetical protein
MIHYHGLPITPVLAMVRAMQGKHAMVSFEHPSQIAEAAEICQSVSLDNGAFSAWKNGRSYDFGGYVEWARHWLRHPAVDWCVIPDVIDGAEADNKRLIQDWPLPPAVSVPVWHLHESTDYLDQLCQTFPRIALGSSGNFADPGTEKWWGRMADAMRAVCDSDGYPRVKIHGLRMLDPVLFSHLPFTSADSCNVARNIGLDVRWKGSYTPASKTSRAIVMIDRIESHAAAVRWNSESSGVSQNYELLG